ncbi:MAG: WhiB family transcriptional regulator [Actinomycetota bacterium]|jgi:WhiB family transcriptional regulator, redox-sensing transcriptional regulator|uniref:WhiB family transcriptional regulator n=1 Tax=uncultured Ilumatobacter sp. TaxID=879968 RepID=UPI00374F4601|nr:WhiB family transcriptional regulator [Actinomycetota bacterium]
MSLQHTNTELKWWHLGACRGLDSKIFYPDDEASSIFAKSVCSTCSVQTECLEHALTIREKAGVWGGASERDRRRIIRQRRQVS